MTSEMPTFTADMTHITPSHKQFLMTYFASFVLINYSDVIGTVATDEFAYISE